MFLLVPFFSFAIFHTKLDTPPRFKTFRQRNTKYGNYFKLSRQYKHFLVKHPSSKKWVKRVNILVTFSIWSKRYCNFKSYSSFKTLITSWSNIFPVSVRAQLLLRKLQTSLQTDQTRVWHPILDLSQSLFFMVSLFHVSLSLCGKIYISNRIYLERNWCCRACLLCGYLKASFDHEETFDHWAFIYFTVCNFSWSVFFLSISNINNCFKLPLIFEKIKCATYKESNLDTLFIMGF